MHFHRILVPTDFSELSTDALKYGAQLAHDMGGRLLVLHVVETLGPENVTYGEATSFLQPEAYRHRLWEELRQIKSPLPDVAVDYLLSEEDPAEAIVHAASAHRCDLIVMGSHGRSGLRRLFMGSVAEHVVRHAPCPVLVIKTHMVPEPDQPATVAG